MDEYLSIWDYQYYGYHKGNGSGDGLYEGYKNGNGTGTINGYLNGGGCGLGGYGQYELDNLKQNIRELNNG
jgi:hypothetical protein